MTWYDRMHGGNNATATYGGIRLADLQKHDRIFHKNGFDPKHDHCSLREREHRDTLKDMALEGSFGTAFRQPKPYEPKDDPVNAAKGIAGKMEAMAREWHKTSKPRRGPEQKPYIVHPEAVVNMLKSWGFDEVSDPVTMGVAWGHDLLEETKITPEKMTSLLGGGEVAKKVVDGIKTLSMDETKVFKDRAEKDAYKASYIENIAKTAAPEVLAVKIADRLSNTLDFCSANNPWGRDYLKLGEPLFRRIDEIPHGEKIKKTLDDVRKLVDRLPKPPPPAPKTVLPSFEWDTGDDVDNEEDFFDDDYYALFDT